MYSKHLDNVPFLLTLCGHCYLRWGSCWIPTIMIRLPRPIWVAAVCRFRRGGHRVGEFGTLENLGIWVQGGCFLWNYLHEEYKAQTYYMCNQLVAIAKSTNICICSLYCLQSQKIDLNDDWRWFTPFWVWMGYRKHIDHT